MSTCDTWMPQRGHFFYVSPPIYDASGFLWGVSFLLQPRPSLAPPPPQKKSRAVFCRYWGMVMNEAPLSFICK